MRSRSNRRRFLSTLAGIGVASVPAVDIASSSRHDGEGPNGGFDPAHDGFGFRNWNARDPEMAVRADPIEEEDIVGTIRDDWDAFVRESMGVSVDQFPDLLISAIARQIYISVNQLSGTNGHCYGMVFSAQRYFEDPDVIPLGRTSASDFAHPAEPLEDSTFNPVLDDIERFHRSQFLDFYSWLGRRASFRPAWIDYRTQLAELKSVVDEFGTAGISMIDSSDNSQHQVLVYGYREHDTGTTLDVYDPNRSADRYAAGSDPTQVEIDTAGDRPRIHPYAKGYDHFVFNRYDRVVRARVEESEPLDRLTVGPEVVRSTLFSVALFLVASPTVALVVVGPDGHPLSRDRGTFMVDSATEYDDMRYRYGADPGTYRVALLGEDDGEYTLSAMAGSLDGDLLDETVTADIAVGEVHRYDVTVPESPADPGTISRVRDDGRMTASSWLAAAGGAGTMAAAGGAYWVVRNRIGGGRE